MTVPPEPAQEPPGARNVPAPELPLPLSEQNPPELPDPPVEPQPEDPGGEATIAT